MQFQVPQFLDIEDKIFGPLTLKQFLYLAGAGAISFVTFFAFETWFWIAITSIATLIAIGLAFLKFNGRPAIFYLFSAIKFAWRPKMYLWKYVAPETVAPNLHSLDREPGRSALSELMLKITTRL
jgi:hypothetical protein